MIPGPIYPRAALRQDSDGEAIATATATMMKAVMTILSEAHTNICILNYSNDGGIIGPEQKGLFLLLLVLHAERSIGGPFLSPH